MSHPAPVDVFVSYARADVAACDAVVEQLRAFGSRVFVDRDSLGSGRWYDQLREAIQGGGRPLVLVIASRAAAGSAMVRQEIQWAREADLVIVPVALAPGWLEHLGLSEFQAVGYLTQPEPDQDSDEWRTFAAGLFQVIWKGPIDASILRWREASAAWAAAVVPAGRPAFWGLPWMTRIIDELRHGRSVTVTAPGGSGKSVLAARVVETLLNGDRAMTPVLLPPEVLAAGPDAVAQFLQAPSAELLTDHLDRLQSMAVRANAG